MNKNTKNEPKNELRRFPFEDDVSLFAKALALIEPHILKTPCPRAEELSVAVGANVYLKLENKQQTGSFKLRGVTNKILSLNPSEAQKTLVAASTGNHGAAFVHMVKELSLQGKLFVPTTIKQVKLAAIKEMGVPYELTGNDCVETELHAINVSKSPDCVFIGPYNDPDVVVGQGTVGVEILEQLGNVDAVFVPVGGGGLISGIATYLKKVSPSTKIIGCQPLNSPVMLKSMEAGEIVSMESLPTLADATAGGIEPGAITFDLCKKYVDDFVTVTEDEIESAIRFILVTENMDIEGGAALSVAALQKTKDKYKGRKVALVISGSKIDPSVIKRIGQSND